MPTVLFRSWVVDGSTLTSASALSAATRIRSTVSAVALGMAMTTVPTPVRATCSPSWEVVPSTGTLRILRWRLRGSSSSRPTGRQVRDGSRSMLPTSSRAASPAPTTSTREAPSYSRLSSSRSRNRRQTARPHAAATRAASVAPTGIVRGIHWNQRLSPKTIKPALIIIVPRRTISSRLAVLARPWCRRTVAASAR